MGKTSFAKVGCLSFLYRYVDYFMGGKKPHFLVANTDKLTVTTSPSTILLPPTLKSFLFISNSPSNRYPLSLAVAVNGIEMSLEVPFIMSVPVRVNLSPLPAILVDLILIRGCSFTLK